MTDLSGMTAQELEKLAKDARELAIKKKEEEKQRLRADLAKRIRDAGFTIEEIFPRSETASKKTRTSEVKYRDPADPSRTWSGRGRKPRWLVDAEAAGRSLKDFAV